MSKKTTYFNKLLLIILVIFSIFFTLYFFNFLLNFFGYQPQNSFYDFAINGKSDQYTIDKNLIYRFKTNELYRNYKIPASSGKKIVMVGDSVTWSYGASDSATYPLTFEKNYQQTHPDTKINVYNYGVPGYGIDQEYILIQNEILPQIKPSTIIWNLNVNDIRDNNYMCLFRYQNDQWQKILATHNIGYWYGWLGTKLPPWFTNSNIFNFFWQKIFRIVTYTTNESLYTFGCSTILRNSNANNLVAKRLTDSIVTLQKILSDKNIHLIVTLVPYQKYFDSRYSSEELDPDYFLIKNTIKDTGVDFLDFNEILLNQINNPLKLNLSYEYFLDSSIDRNPDGIRHPNQKMYDLMSKSLLEFIDKYSLNL